MFTGILTLTIEYKTLEQKLLFKQVIADDLFPWEYSSTAKTFVTIESQAGTVRDQQSSEVHVGVHRIPYVHNFEFKVCETDLEQMLFLLTVWQKHESGDESLVGKCTVAMDTMKITAALGQSCEVSKTLIKQSVSAIFSEIFSDVELDQ